MMERDALGFLAWIVWEIDANGVAKRHLSLFSQLRNGNPCEHFIHRAEIKLGIDLGWHVEVLLGHPIRFQKKQQFILRNQDRSRELVRSDELLQKGFQFLKHLDLPPEIFITVK
jgi:hypothetical protein